MKLTDYVEYSGRTHKKLKPEPPLLGKEVVSDWRTGVDKKLLYSLVFLHEISYSLVFLNELLAFIYSTKCVEITSYCEES